MGWLPAARGYAAATDPLRFGNHTFDGRYLARPRRLPCSPWLKGRSGRGFAGLPLDAPGTVVLCLSVRRFCTGWQRCARMNGSPRSRRPARSSGPEQMKLCPPHRRWMACGPLDVDDAVGMLSSRTAPVEMAGGRRQHRSGCDPQCYQPFELADFVAKTAHVRAVCRLQPDGGGEVTVPGRSVPVARASTWHSSGSAPQEPSPRRRRPSRFRVRSTAHGGGRFLAQHLAVERVR
jgi:hypothetical protein